ncbi:MAG: class I SAM-dependent methyltransferase [Planctomycetota bacterium]|nr:class I SAM-dependent methyltransferase [Planctomycetota bacterium]
MNITAKNSNAWDRMARSGHVLATPATDEELRNPLRSVDEIGWLGGSIQGWRVLCLAAGGGRHGPLYCAAGAEVTVADISPGMLEIDREVAMQRKMDIRLIECDMCDLSSLQKEEFDLVVHPVSTCYIDRPSAVFHEVARVLRTGGLYISQHKQPMNLQASLVPNEGNYVIERPATSGSISAQATLPSRLREPGTDEIIHSLQSILGGICRAGFVIEDLVEPHHAKPDHPPGSFGHRCSYIPPYIRIKSRRLQNTVADSPASKPKIWLGD